MTLRCALFAVVFLLCGAALSPQVLAQASGSSALPQPTAEQAQRWMREHVAAFVGPQGATAAAAAVVADGKVLAFASYGWFDPVRRIEIEPQDQFLVGSITKMFVSLLTAKLVEQGVIASVDDPVNRYLKRYQIPPPEGPKVTLAQLATHTSGMESPGFGIASHDQREVPADAAYLRAKIPNIVRPPGYKAVYANFGPVLLGAAIEDVTGQRLDRVVDRMLLKPLGMDETILGYDVTGGPRLVYAGIQQSGSVRYAVRTLNAPVAAPAGSIQATAADMARFMNALLGHVPDVVTPAMIALEREPRAVNYPGLSPIGLGLFLDQWNATPVLGHGGLIAGFRSTLAIVPSHDFGVFVVFAGGADAYSSGPGDPGAAVDAMLVEVLGPAQPLPVHASTDPSHYAGRYWLELRAHTTPEVLFGLDRVTSVTAAPDGGLLLDHGGGNPEHVFEVAPGLFQGPAHDNRRPSLYGFEPGLMLMNKMYAVRVRGFKDPRNWQRGGVLLLAVAALGLCALFWPGPGRLESALTGVAALLAAYTFVWPVLKDIDVDTSLFLGRAWRFDFGRIAAWTFLLAGGIGIIRTFSLLKSGGTGRPGNFVLMHRAAVALACVGLSCLAFAVHLLW
ncbi:MAG TPA: serine hydrolase domain-containing protein [Steroidobacteraceae bacterium]|nr:serine hydrolase domain-containing protein [Steroidobacteraceae bacterium]